MHSSIEQLSKILLNVSIYLTVFTPTAIFPLPLLSRLATGCWLPLTIFLALKKHRVVSDCSFQPLLIVDYLICPSRIRGFPFATDQIAILIGSLFSNFSILLFLIITQIRHQTIYRVKKSLTYLKNKGSNHAPCC